MYAGIQIATTTLRTSVRLAWLAWVVGRDVLTAPRSAPESRLKFSGTSPHHCCARWLHLICHRVARLFHLQIDVTGRMPARGLLVANHLSYLDIIVLASRQPCVFVSKSEVASWPVFGWFARRAGTIFVNRRSRADVARAGDAIRAALRAGALMVLFPEGTSSDGAAVLPFKSSLLEPAIGAHVPIHVGALAYHLDDGDARHEACYWGNHTLVPHLLRLLSKRQVRVSLALSEVRNTWRDRKKLAAQLHAEVTALHRELKQARPCDVAVEATKLHCSTGKFGLFDRSLLTSAAKH